EAGQGLGRNVKDGKTGVAGQPDDLSRAALVALARQEDPRHGACFRAQRLQDRMDAHEKVARGCLPSLSRSVGGGVPAALPRRLRRGARVAPRAAIPPLASSGLALGLARGTTASSLSGPAAHGAARWREPAARTRRMRAAGPSSPGATASPAAPST